jgi:hypothetical protein
VEECIASAFNFTFGDFVAHGIDKQLRLWKFDVKNELGIYVGQSDTSKHTHRIYDPYKHKVYERTGVYRINISSEQYLKWYSNRLYMREGKIPYSIVEDAIYSFFSDADENNDIMDNNERDVSNEEQSTPTSGQVFFNPTKETVDIMPVWKGQLMRTEKRL